MTQHDAPKLKRFALQTWTVRRELVQDAEGTLAKLVQLGIGAIEVAGTGHLTWKQFGQLCERNKLMVVSLHHSGLEAASLDSVCIEYIAACRALNTDCVIVSSNPHRRPKTALDYTRYGQVLRDATIRLADSGIKLGYHCYSFDLSPLTDSKNPGVDILLDLVPFQTFSLQLDTYFASRDRLTFDSIFKLYMNMCTSVHLNDIDAHGNQTYLGDPTARLDWTQIIRLLSTTPKPLTCILEHKTEIPFDWIDKSLQFLRAKEAIL